MFDTIAFSVASETLVRGRLGSPSASGRTARLRGRRALVKFLHEIRDPVHGFITVNSHERRVVDSPPVQRLRHISQLAMSPLVYPGATHRRFEHSLGVMHLAGAAFDVLTRHENVSDAIREVVPELNEPENFPYWRSVVRMAALCHDIGHPPFSHAAEHGILPEGTTHETIGGALIESPEMATVFKSMTPSPSPDVVAKLAIGPEKSGSNFNVWEAILSEVVTGDAFGVDRVDYLLRDSLHAGVAYGRFDHLRLIQTLRLLQPKGGEGDASLAPVIGVEEGGLNAAEGLLLARYFMFGQVYFHPVRVIYDIHLIDFLKLWLLGGKYSGDLQDHLRVTDNDVWVAITAAGRNPKDTAHDPARRILERDHFKEVYRRRASDVEIYSRPGQVIADWAKSQYGSDAVRYRRPHKSGGAVDFPVRESAGTVASSTSVSETLRSLPPNTAEFVFIRPDLLSEARAALAKDNELVALLSRAAEEEAQFEDEEAASEITDDVQQEEKR